MARKLFWRSLHSRAWMENKIQVSILDAFGHGTRVIGVLSYQVDSDWLI